MSEGSHSPPGAWAIVAAAGTGERFGGKVAKQFLPCGGVSLLQASLRTLWNCPEVKGMVVVMPPASVDRSLLPGELADRREVLTVAGGKRRLDSVREGFNHLPDDCELVLVHDAVRPRVRPDLVGRVVSGAWRDGACIPVVAVHDTVKRIDGEGRVLETLDREALRLSQTPQGFRRELLARALDWAQGQEKQVEYTDSASLVEAFGEGVRTVAGDPGNIKVTVPPDLGRLGLLTPRVGYGYDVHRLESGRKLVLGGVTIPHPLGLVGYSDGDCVLHALADALLGAAGLGDIGRMFPDDDPAYAGADSLDLLGRVVQAAGRAGFRVSSADLTVVAQEPRLAQYLPRMAKTIAPVLGVDPGAVGVKATTEEGLGFTGQRQGIAAYAVAVLVVDGG